MNHWQFKARNKASEEKRKAQKQGESVVNFIRIMREAEEHKKKLEASVDFSGKDGIQDKEVMEGFSGKVDQETWPKV